MSHNEPSSDTGQPTAFFDVDQTLVGTPMLRPDDTEGAARLGAVNIDGRWYVARPGADELLSDLSREGVDLNVLTSGDPEFQTEVLDRVGLLPHFSNVYGPSSEFEAPANSVLVDDLSPAAAGTMHKLEQLGFTGDASYGDHAESMFVRCAAFDGRQDRAPIGDLLPDILGRLGEAR